MIRRFLAGLAVLLGLAVVSVLGLSALVNTGRISVPKEGTEQTVSGIVIDRCMAIPDNDRTWPYYSRAYIAVVVSDGSTRGFWISSKASVLEPVQLGDRVVIESALEYGTGLPIAVRVTTGGEAVE